MNSFFSYLLLGGQAGGDGPSSGGMSGIMSFVPFILIIGIFYFLIIRPQNKKQKDTKKMLEALKRGDKIVTIGGIHGTIQTVDQTEVVVKVDDGTKIKFSRSAIATVVAGDSQGAIEREEKSKKAQIEAPAPAEKDGDADVDKE
jgi:preprotein translocase subunit YajC